MIDFDQYRAPHTCIPSLIKYAQNIGVINRIISKYIEVAQVATFYVLVKGVGQQDNTTYKTTLIITMPKFSKSELVQQ